VPGRVRDLVYDANHPGRAEPSLRGGRLHGAPPISSGRVLVGQEQVTMKRPASLVTAILLWLIALAQLLRVLLRVEVKAGDVSIPLWVSIPVFVVLAALGTWLWRERRV
jgi:uncharacterized membrane protein